MPFPKPAVRHDAADQSDAEILVLLLPPLDSPTMPDLTDRPGLGDALAQIGFTGAPGEVVRVPDASAKRLAVAGTGADPSPAAVRESAGAAIRTLTGFASAALVAPGLSTAHQRAALEGAALGGYWFEDYKSGDERKRPPALVTVHDAGLQEQDALHVQTVAAAVALTKDLATAPAQWLGPQELADRAIAELADLPVHVHVADEEELAREGYGGILGVGQGSARPPRLVRLDYAPDEAIRHVALVGKGITFDTGGLSLKPPASMVGMKSDMTGAATVLSVVRAAAALALPVRVTGWMCIADNMPSGSAIRPGDVVRIANGTTVEVLNTDAEGRLVLADGLVAASAEHPDIIIDVATLTGAILVALGTRHTGVMGSDEAVAEYLDASTETAEDAWHLPLPPYMEKELDSPIADLQNAKIGDRAGGSIFAGLFLQRFVGRISDDPDAERIPWVHLDIAGSGENGGAPYGFTGKGATGATVRSLLRVIEGGVDHD